MRICQFIPSVRPDVGGPARAVLDLCRALSTRGHQVTLATCDRIGVPDEWDEGGSAGPGHVLLPRPALHPLAFSAAQVRQTIRPMLDGADALHLHGVWEPLNIQLGRVATSAGVPYFISIRGMLDDWCVAQKALKKQVFLNLVGRRWLNGARVVHSTANRELAESQKRFSHDRCVIIPNLLDLGAYADLPGPELALREFPILAGDEPIVLSLSRIHPIKQLECLIRASAILCSQGLRIRTVIAGSGDERYIERLRALADEEGLTDQQIQFVGQVVGELKLSLYQVADLFALPSAHENFGFVIAESLACGTPVVTTPGVKTRDELEESGAAVISPAKPDEFARAIRGLVEGGSCSEMGRVGREWVFEWLDTDRLLDQFEAMYRCDGDAVP